LRDAKNSNNFLLKMLWSEEYGSNAFGEMTTRRVPSEKLLEKITSVFGKIREIRRKTPPLVKFSFHRSVHLLNLTAYQSIQKNSVLILSTRKGSTIWRRDKKPETLQYCNKNKFGFGIFDYMRLEMRTRNSLQKIATGRLFNYFI